MATERQTGTTGADQDAFFAAMAAAKAAPDEASTWDRVESLAAELDQPEQAVRLYGEVLAADLPPKLISSLGKRAAKFHDEWFGEHSPELAGVLQRVVDIDVTSEWAFQRLTVVLTTAERWDELLGLYDRALERIRAKSRRARLLDEAANAAKDFAGDTDRAIRYLLQLRELKPRTKSVAVTLERLFERGERWSDLIELWTSRLDVASAADARELRELIAACWLEKLGDAENALRVIDELLEAGGDDTESCRLLEGIVRGDSVEWDTRERALRRLQQRYEHANRERDIVAAIEAAIEHADSGKAAQLREEAGHILSTLGEGTGSFEHYAAVLLQDPSNVSAQEELRHLSHQIGGFERYAAALTDAADRAGDPARAIALLSEAAVVFRDSVGSADRAIELYARAFALEGAPDGAAYSLCRDYDAALAAAGRDAARLDVLARLATVEDSDAARRDILGELARIAERLEDPDRAAAAWAARLEEAPADIEALDALVALRERNEQWSELVEALRRRAAAPVPAHQRRDDLTRIALLQRERLDSPERAIEAWRELHESFGETADSVDALAALYAETEQWTEQASLLDRAAARDMDRSAGWYARVGDARRLHLDDPRRAVDAYRAALAHDPKHEVARAGLSALLEDDACRPEALSVLAAVCDRTGDWEGELGLVDARIAETEDTAAQAALLGRAAELHERRAGAPDAALAAMRRALALTPHDAKRAAELVRLGSVTGQWADVCAGLREAAGATEAADVIERLRTREAEIADEHLGDAAAALEAYRAASAVRPDDPGLCGAVAEVAARAGDWRVAMSAAVARVGLEDRVDADRFEALAATAQQSDQLAAAASALGEAIEDAAPDPRHACALQKIVAAWRRDRLDDAAGAREALRRAVDASPTDRDALVQLAELQRDTPDVALLDTLLRLSHAVEDDLDALYEAVELASDTLGDAKLARTNLESLAARASRLWRASLTASGTREAEATAQWALAALLDSYTDTDERPKAIALAIDALGWPVDAARRTELRTRAAALAADDGQTKRAADLYRDLLADRPNDVALLDRLASLYEQLDSIPDLVAIRRTQLGLCEDPDERIPLRLAIARLVGVMEQRGRRVETLLENLEERPGHPDSLEALCEVFAARARYRDMAEMLERQANALRDLGESDRAAQLWLRAARVCETELADPSRALDGYRAAAELAPESAQALDGVARLHVERGEHADALPWIERLLASAPESDRTGVRLRLAQSRLAVGNAERAIQCLEDAGDARASKPELREMLSGLYRDAEAWAPLARLLTESLEYLTDGEALATAREASAIFRERLEAPERAIPALRRAVELSPGDHDLRTQLAEGLRLAGQFQESRDVLEEMIEQFGRRRSTDRAEVHHQLALVARAQGDIDEALVQLDLATKMDVGNAEMLRLQAELARSNDRREQAERAYRALLLVVRRRDATDDETAIGPAEVLFELHYLAAELGDDDRASELRESAMEAAVDSDVEVRRARRTLRKHDDETTLREVLRERLEVVKDAGARAQTLAYLADSLAKLGDTDDAVEAALDAIRSAPGRDDLHEAAQGIARRAERAEDYLELVRDLAGKMRRKEDADQAAVLYGNLGKALEVDMDDLDGAAEAYQKMADTGVRAAAAYSALARVSGARGDTAAQTKALEHLLRLADESSPAARADALYQIAEINAVREDALGEALEQLDAALEAEPRFERACAILRAALDASPESDAALAAYERVARRANDRDVLLDMFERKASAPGATPESLREGVEVAMATDARERAGALLERIVDIARSSNDGLAGHTWAPLQLIELRMSDGELQTAATLVMELCQLAGVDAVWTMATQLAEQARGDGKLDIAGQLLQMLRDYRPDAREVWEPLFRLYMEQHEYEALEHLAGQTVLSLVDVSERNALRMLYGEFLEQDPDRKRAALETYKDVLLDDPGHSSAAARLEAMIEETGTHDEIVAFLTQRFDDARDRGDADTIADAALRLGARLSDSDPYEAVAVYRSAAELAPGNAAVLRALIDLLADSADPGELADWKEKLLAVSQGDDAEPLALDVYALRNDAGDAAGALRALEAGRAVAPESEKLLAALQSWYRDNGKMRPLAELLAAEAERLGDPARSVDLLSEVTSIYRDMLMDPVGAIDAIRKAATIAPQDMGLLSELVRTLLAQGDTAAAIAETEAALERGIDDDSDRADVLLSQAEARLSAGDAIRAIDDIERAYAIDADRALPTFGPALKAARNQARDEGDFEQERAATLRFAELHRAHGNPTACRQVLEAWLDMQPEDTGAMALLCDLHEAEQDWHALMVVCGRLALRSEGDEQLASAHRLAEATAKVEDSSAARGALELVFAEHPDDRVLSGALRGVYERTGANSELAALIRHDADQTDDDDERLALLLRAADLLIASDAPADAVPVLERARALDPGDQGVALRFIDALVATGQLAEARAQLEPLAKTATKKRSAASSRVMQRLARLCLAEGDTESGLKWLEKSFDINRSDGHLAADVARIAVEQRSYPLAIKALRTISLKKLDGPISVEQAIVDEGKIELALGNPAKARMLANKVLRSDPTFAPAQQLLELVKQ